MADQYTTMSIASFGPATLGHSAKITNGPFLVKNTNDISDIDGARRYNKFEQFATKHVAQTSDVMGATSKPLTHSRNTRDNSLYIDDIEGTRNRVKDRMAITERHVNPLNPSYQIPSYVPAEPAPTKFIRDELYHSDVEGSHSKPLYRTAVRDILGVNDIEGAQVSSKMKNRPPRDILNCSDVSSRNRYIDKTFRVSNSLDPVYVVNGMEVADDLRYTKPKAPKQTIFDSHLLQTHDIAGATSGWREKQKERRDFRQTNFIGDINGAHADTVKHSIVTNRESNPLMPVYQALDPGEKLDPIVKPLLPANLISTPTIRSMKSTHGPTGDSEKFSLGHNSGVDRRSNSVSQPATNSQPQSAPRPTDNFQQFASSWDAGPSQPSSSTSYANKFQTTENFNFFPSSGNQNDFGFGAQPSKVNSGDFWNTGTNNDFTMSKPDSGRFNSGMSMGATSARPPSWGNTMDKSWNAGSGAINNGFSPQVSGRQPSINSGRQPTQAERKASRERQQEIDSVRNL